MSRDGFSDLDARHMALALELAERGLYTTTPNPRVGSVIAHGDKIVGQGWHRKAGEAHAEINALNDAGDQSLGATVYVTLEPCSFTGRTGPCADALIAAGVGRVVYAMEDPNRKVAGQGAERMRAAGIQVETGLMTAEAEALNRGFIKRMNDGSPFVRLKAASSLDGRSAMANGESQWITSETSRNDAQRLRAASCAIVTGVDTLLQDNPRYTVREEALGQSVERQPDLWVCDSSLRVSPGLHALAQAKGFGRTVVVVTTHSTFQNQEAKVAKLHDMGVVVLACGGLNDEGSNDEYDDSSNRKVDLHQLMLAMSNRQVNELLVEAGPRLSASFLKEGLVDELIWYLAPKLMGAAAMPVFDLSYDSLAETAQMQIAKTESCGQDLKLTLKPA